MPIAAANVHQYVIIYSTKLQISEAANTSHYDTVQFNTTANHVVELVAFLYPLISWSEQHVWLVWVQ